MNNNYKHKLTEPYKSKLKFFFETIIKNNDILDILKETKDTMNFLCKNKEKLNGFGHEFGTVSQTIVFNRDIKEIIDDPLEIQKIKFQSIKTIKQYAQVSINKILNS